jgi:hypothetical protein
MIRTNDLIKESDYYFRFISKTRGLLILANTLSFFNTVFPEWSTL